MINYYDVLSISYNASVDDIKRAYRQMIKKYHPDLNNGQGHNIVNLINKAYKTLINQDMRRKYDRLIFEFIGYSDRSKKHVIKIPDYRIVFSCSLANLATKGLLHKKFRRIDRIRNLKEDIKVFITRSENEFIKMISIGIPIKIPCPHCMGSKSNCPVCNGLGYVKSIEKTNLMLPQNCTDGDVFRIDLKSVKLHHLRYFTMKELIIRVKIIGFETLYRLGVKS